MNLLPYSVYEKLGLGELQPTKVTIQLADRSVKIPHGIVEDVIIQVDKFYFPVNFLVLDVEPIPNAKKQIPMILGRPFLATANVLINCRTGVLELSFGNMNVRLNVFHAANQPSSDDDCYMIDFREVLEDDFAMLWGDDELVTCEDGSDIFEVNNSITDL